MNKYLQGIFCCLLLISCTSNASKFLSSSPIFLITPTISAPSTLIDGQTTSAVYQVTNTSKFPLSNIRLFMQPGVTPNVGSVSQYSDYCPSPFSLGPGSSCLIKVNLNSNLLGSGIMSGPRICFMQPKPKYCSQPFATEQLNTIILSGLIPQDCNSNVANFNYELMQNFDSTTSFTVGWGPARNPLILSPSNPNLTNCPTSAGITWERQRIIAAASFWIAQKLNYCHHYNPDYATPPNQRNAGGTSGGYCNPALDTMPGSVYYGQQARWNYTGIGSETANNWVNNNQMWYGMDCSNTTAFLYNFAFGPNPILGIPFDSKTSNQAGQYNIGNQNQDMLSPNHQFLVARY